MIPGPLLESVHRPAWAYSSELVGRPVADASFSFAPALAAEKTPITFTASFLPANATQPVTYTWTFGDGSAPIVSTHATMSHTFANTGNYTVVLTTTNGYGSPVVSNAAVTVAYRVFLPMVYK